MILQVRVRAGSARQRCFLNKKGQLVVEVKSPAEHNRANLEVVKFFENKLRLPINAVRIKTGMTQPLKTVSIDAVITKEEVYARLGLAEQIPLL